MRSCFVRLSCLKGLSLSVLPMSCSLVGCLRSSFVGVPDLV